MMTYLDEGYKMQVELMRHQIKAAENQREIDLERMQAQNKGKAKPLFRNYCPMCNINFYGPLTGHRKSDRHRVSKIFILYYTNLSCYNFVCQHNDFNLSLIVLIFHLYRN